MTDLLFSLSRTFDVKRKSVALRKKSAGLAGEVYDASLMHIEDVIRYSTNHAFR